MFTFDRKQRPSLAHSPAPKPASQQPEEGPPVERTEERRHSIEPRLPSPRAPTSHNGREPSQASVEAEPARPLAPGPRFEFARLSIIPPPVQRKPTVSSPNGGGAQDAVVRRKPADAAEATEVPTPHSQWVVKTPQGGNLLLRVVADHPTELSDGTPNTVGNLSSGTVVEIIEKKNDLGWYQVTGEVGLDGGLREKRTGFVHRKYLFPVGPANPEGEKKAPDSPSPADTPADEKLAPVVDEVIQWENYVDPEASGGTGDFAKAFGVLKPLEMQALLTALVKLDARFMLELLYDNIGAAPEEDRPRVAIAIMAVLARRGKRVGRGDGPEFFKALNPSDQTTLKTFASTIDAHWQTLLFEGEQQEIDRLAGLQQQFLEDKRKAQEAALRKKQEAEAQANNAPPPAPEAAPKVDIGQIIEQEVSSRELKPIPTKVWDDLSDKDKNEVWPKRASTAFDNIRASLKGTELEHVMDGHDFVFEPRKILERGAYAYQGGTDLVCGMTFVKDAESDPKNVWPIVAHEIGGHAAYGSTYAKKIMDKFLASLPEAEQQKWTQDKATGFFDAFMYAETEIFSALRQRRYDVPESGPAPVHGGMKPDANIETRLQAIDQAFPKELGRAILLELNERVKADPQILERDKKIFVEQAKNHGYSL